MIVTDLENAEKQIVMTPNMENALKFLHQPDLQAFADGKILIDGDKVFAIVDSYETRILTDPLELEAHKKYIDIQYIVAGQEMIGWASVKMVFPTAPYNETRDFWPSNLSVNKVSWVKLSARLMAVLYPADAHAPQITDGRPSVVKKIVVKVAI